MNPIAMSQRPPLLDLFCFRYGELWLVNISPAWTPPLLNTFFDQYGESSPTLLDFDDLDEYMADHGATYQKRVSKLGGVQITAEGNAAKLLANWFATAFASGIRRPATGQAVSSAPTGA